MMHEVISLVDSKDFSGHALQSAIESLSSGGEILLGAGTYFVENTILLTSHITLRGQGRSKTTIELVRGASCHVFSNRDHRAGNSDISIIGLTIEGNMEHQEKPDKIIGLTFCCAMYFKKCQNIYIQNVQTINIRQTGCHFSGCDNVKVLGFSAERVGWSGISTSGTNNMYSDSIVIESGLDIMHSALHFDGGTNVAIKSKIEHSTGNGVMLDSAFSAFSICAVNAEASYCKRGLSLSGSHNFNLAKVYAQGKYFNNRECGVMISNSNDVTIANATITDNVETGILFQGKKGGNECLIVDTNIKGHKNDVLSLHASKNNYFMNTTVPENPSATSCAAASNQPKEKAKNQPDRYRGSCVVCGKFGTFVHSEKALRESYRCEFCRASLRHRCQAQAILHALDSDLKSIFELAEKPNFENLSIYEPGIIGPFRKYFVDSKKYVISYFYPDVDLGKNVDGIRNENLESLTFPDDMFDLVITSDIFEHIRDPYSAFKEVNRVLKPGASHVFTIPILRPFQQKTVRRVCTDTDEDIHLLPPHYHIAGDGGKSLVYNDFGIDLIAKLESQMTVKLKVFDFQAESSTAPKEVGRVLCFIATKL